MTRWLSTVVAIAVGASAMSCNTPVCGDGTKQVQNKDGSVQCVAVDAQPATIPCDTEHGAVIIGGICTSQRTCDPASTTEVNGVCVGTGGSADAPPPCPPPSAGTFCVNGLIRDILDNGIHKARIHVAWYDPLDFLSGGAAKAELDTDTGGYVFRDQSPTGTGLIAIAVGDADRGNVTFVTAGSGAQNVQAGKSYRVDGYAIPRSLVNMWNSQSGTDWVASGGYLARYFSDMKPPETNLAATETSPVMGVQHPDGHGQDAAQRLLLHHRPVDAEHDRHQHRRRRGRHLQGGGDQHLQRHGRQHQLGDAAGRYRRRRHLRFSFSPELSGRGPWRS